MNPACVTDDHLHDWREGAQLRETVVMEMNLITQPVPTPAPISYSTEMLVVIGAFTVILGAAGWKTIYNGPEDGPGYSISFGRLTERIHLFIWEGEDSIGVSSSLHSDLGGVHNRKGKGYGLEENLQAVREWIRFFDI